MKSAIKTLENAKRGLEMELKTWSKPPNYAKKIINEVKVELQEHNEVLELLKNKL